MKRAETFTVLGANWRLANAKSSMVEDTIPCSTIPSHTPRVCIWYEIYIHIDYTYGEGEETQEGSPTNNILVGKYRLRRAEMWQNIPRVSSDVGEI